MDFTMLLTAALQRTRLLHKRYGAETLRVLALGHGHFDATEIELLYALRAAVGVFTAMLRYNVFSLVSAAGDWTPGVTVQCKATVSQDASVKLLLLDKQGEWIAITPYHILIDGA